MPKAIDTILAENGGKFPHFAWPGGYPLFYICADDGILCPQCANDNKPLTTASKNSSDYDPQWAVFDAEVNWEDQSLHCDHCHGFIGAAYGA